MSTEIIYLFDPETREYVGEQPNRFDALEGGWTMYPQDHASITHEPPPQARSGFKLIYDFDYQWKYVTAEPPPQPAPLPAPEPQPAPADPHPADLHAMIAELQQRVAALESDRSRG